MARKLKEEKEDSNTATVPIVFHLPAEMVSEFNNKRKINDKEIGNNY